MNKGAFTRVMEDFPWLWKILGQGWPFVGSDSADVKIQRATRDTFRKPLRPTPKYGDNDKLGRVYVVISNGESRAVCEAKKTNGWVTALAILQAAVVNITIEYVIVYSRHVDYFEKVVIYRPPKGISFNQLFDEIVRASK